MKNQTSTILRALAEAEEYSVSSPQVRISIRLYATLKAAKLREIARRIENESQDQAM